MRYTRVQRLRGFLLCVVFTTLYYTHTILVPSDVDPHQNLSSDQLWLLNSLRSSLRKHKIEFSDEDVPESLQDTFLHTQEVERLRNITARQFNRYLISSIPFILTQGPSCTSHPWDLQFISKMAGRDVVGIETSKSNRFYSNEGLRKVNMTVNDFLLGFRDPNRPYDMYLAEESMDRTPGLRDDVSEPEFSEMLNLDRLQLWIGAGGQVAPLHHDQWDNVLCQIQGTRNFLLFDPLQVDRLYPKKNLDRHFSQIDPSKNREKLIEQYPLFAHIRTYKATLQAGEIMFIPAMWWHQVHHHDSVNIAINFWYDTHILGELVYDNVLPPGSFD
eukprot:PhF_6_TR8992/c0_g1_i1/m.14121/K10277/KDM8, JMJD5; lysine-specific demethylase 8